MNLKSEIDRLKQKRSKLFKRGTLNIVNGEHLFNTFIDQQLVDQADLAPFNEAMCVNQTTEPIFTESFINLRAIGHHQSVETYTSKVIQPLKNLLNKQYQQIALWFGKDMFCQINLLTLLAFLEQSNYRGKVFLNQFNEGESIIDQTELKLGNYQHIYKTVLINQQKPMVKIDSQLDSAINLYLNLLKDDNLVTAYIAEHRSLSDSELVNHLIKAFPQIGYGDTQYIELINKRN